MARSAATCSAVIAAFALSAWKASAVGSGGRSSPSGASARAVACSRCVSVAAAPSRSVRAPPRLKSSRTVAITDVWSKTVESTTPFCTHGEITTARHARTEPVEAKRRTDRDLAVRIDRRRRRHVIVEAAVLVEQDDEQRRIPGGGPAQRLVDVRDEVLAETHVVRRMLIVRLPSQKVEVAWLDERVGGQPAVLQIEEELLREPEVGSELRLAQRRDGVGMRKVVEVDRPVIVVRDRAGGRSVWNW